jgi:hypothetical protein
VPPAIIEISNPTIIRKFFEGVMPRPLSGRRCRLHRQRIVVLYTIADLTDG